MTQLLNHQQQIPQQSFLPLELATKYYVKWDCDIEVKSTSNGYYKCLQGYGQVEFSNGNAYKGKFSNGLMHGQGEFVWACGLKYKGPFVNNAITGQGLYEWTDGSWYKGGLLNGKRHGKGEYYCQKDKSKYNGEWKQGIRHGNGILQFNEQTSYEGEFCEGFRHGKGKMKYGSGNVYQGEWKNDKKSGYGVMNWFTQNEKYEGEWLNDLQHGLGTYYWFDGKIEYKIIKNIYKGNWVHGQRQGYGSFFYSNGCRYEGYFQKNQKNGQGLVMDENGNVKLEYFQKDRLMYTIPESNLATLAMNKAQNNNATDKKAMETIPKLSHVKSQPNSIHAQNSSRGAKLLPSVQKTGTKQNGITQQVHQQSNQTSQKESKLKIEQNIYTKCLDIPLVHQLSSHQDNPSGPQFMICKQIMNLLLRQNSHLRQWYKHCSLTISTSNNSGNSNNKDFYTGVTIENLSKLIKDLRIIDDFITIPKINRQFFYQGWKSSYDVVLPNQQKLNMIKEYLQKEKTNVNTNESSWQKIFNNEKINYSNIEWYNYVHQLQQMSQCDTQEAIDLNLLNDIQNPKKIILFRHFVCYLLRIAYLQTLKLHISKPSSEQSFQKSFRQTLQKLFKTINSIYESAQRQAKGIQSTDNLTFVSKQKANMNLSVEYTKPNEELFTQITKNYQNLTNFVDNTVTVKVLYQLLDKFSILKEPAEKLLFLQKIERFMEPGFNKNSLLRKELKAYFPALQKVLYSSPYFQRIMNYTLIQKQFEELLYIAVNRKINSNCKEQAVKKYREIIDQIINYVKKESTSNVCEPKKSTLKMKKPLTSKDKQKIQLINDYDQMMAASRQAQRKRLQLERQCTERNKMNREDFRWEEDEMQQSDQYFD